MELDKLLSILREYNVTEYECNGMRVCFGNAPMPAGFQPLNATGADIDPDDFEVSLSEMQIIGDDE